MTPIPLIRKVAAQRGAPRDTLIDELNFAQVQALEKLGSELANHNLVKLLGVGSAGAVYEAEHVLTGRRVAIKVLHGNLRKKAESKARFLREARAISSMGHPNIVRLLDAGEESDTVYQIFELLRGRDLFDVIENERLGTRELVDIGVQLLDALEAAHERGILHRDVKPENIFLAETGEPSPQVKLLDFGIAKFLDARGISWETVDGVALGTPHYMCPEQCRGQEPTVQWDIWSAGAVLFHAFTGDPPFDDVEIGRLLMKIVENRAPSLREQRPDLPDPIIQVVDLALRQLPEERWHRISAMRDTLKETLAGL